jgi:hypothetical protein
MTDPFEEHGERLRRVLRAEAEEIMPGPDGLERIRSRTSAGERLGRWAWFTASWTRPLVAVGGAVLIAVVAVSAPPTINHITSLTGEQGSTPHHATSENPGEAPPTEGPSSPVGPDGQPSQQGGVPPSLWTTIPPQTTPCLPGRGVPPSPGATADRKTPTARRTDRTIAKPTCQPAPPTAPSTPSTHSSSASPSNSSSSAPSGSAVPGQGGQP